MVRRAVRRVVRTMIGAAAALVEPRVTKGVTRALHTLRDELYLQRLHRASTQRAKRVSRNTPVRLNLGSGFHPKRGWINVDLIDNLSDLQLDLRERLPFDDQTVSQIYSEHFFEHLSFTAFGDSLARQIEAPGQQSDALAFLRECCRVLVPGSRIDIVVPNAEKTLLDYAATRMDASATLDDWWGPGWCDTAMHRVNYVFRQGHEHQYAWDFETLRSAMEIAGFVDVTQRCFDAELDHHNPRRSLFVVARKPA